MKESNKEQQMGDRYFALAQNAETTKYLLNHYKLLLGKYLNELKELHEEEEIKENYGSFDSFLASIKLNRRRTHDLLLNSAFVERDGISDADWKFLDSSIVSLARKKNISLKDMMEDVKELSYSDLLKII
jgi:hypothetical protein